MKSNRSPRQPPVSSPQRTPPKLFVVLPVLLLCGIAFGLRLLHVLNDDHFFVISPDSYYFHRMAQLLVEDQTYFYPIHDRILPIAAFSGITYPLAAIASAISIFTPLSGSESLELVSKLLPPILGVLTTVVLYMAVSRMFGRLVALFSAFSWAIVPWGVLHQSSGYLDRDCLSMLLVVVGVFLFFSLSRSPGSAAFGKFNRLAPALAVIAIELLLYLEWGFVGPAILLAILAGFYLLHLVAGILARVMPSVLAEEDPVRMFLTFSRGSLAALRSIMLKGALTRSFALLLVINLVVTVFRPSLFRSMYNNLVGVFTGAVGGEQTVAELGGIGPSDILSFSFLLIPVAIGLYVLLKRRASGDLLILGWFLALFLAGLFARRLFLYATPAVCIMAGVGFGALLHTKNLRPSFTALFTLALVNPRRLVPYLRIGLAVLVVILVVYVSANYAYSFGSRPPTAANNQWYDALTWLKDNTDDDAVVMTWWDYGYWILDIAQRVPVVDNGIHPEDTDADIARLYCAFDDSEAVTIMDHYGAEYLIFSKADARLLPTISQMVLNAGYGDGASIPPELEGSLYARSLSETFHSDSSLQRVYQFGDASDPYIVILARG